MSNKVIKAAINGQRGFQGKAYLFNGRKYIRYDWNDDLPDGGYPKDLSLWKLTGNFANGIDSAINGLSSFDGYAYLFKGDEYVKYSWEEDKPVDGYPKPLSLWKLPSDFGNGIDAAFNGGGDLDGFGYLVKGDRYVKYDWANDKPVDGYPRPLSAWKLPADFNDGIDAAINGDGPFSNYVYFFKGDQYVRYDWSTFTAEGPWPIAKYWHIESAGSADQARELYHEFDLDGEISFEAFRIAHAGYSKIDNGVCASNATKTNRKWKKEPLVYDKGTGYLVIIDFTKPSNERRMVVLNMLTRTKRNYLYVSHGIGTAPRQNGKIHARYFSNTPNTNQSSLGFFVTGWTYQKDKPKRTGGTDKRVWLRLNGLEKGINDKAFQRGVMMHTAHYVNEDTGSVGRSHGCPAIADDENEIVDEKLKNRLLEEIKDGNLLFQYTDMANATDDLGNNYYDMSTLLKCLENEEESSFRIVHEMDVSPF